MHPKVAGVLLLLLTLCSTNALAQKPLPRVTRQTAKIISPTLSGRVVDPTGAPIRCAGITIKNTATGQIKAIGTNAQGFFDFGRVDAGMYDVETRVPALEALERRRVKVEVGQAARLTVILKVEALRACTMLKVLPEGEPEPEPATTPSEESSIHVVRKKLNDDLEAQEWLNAQAQEQRVLLAIIPLGRLESLFVFRTTKKQRVRTPLVLPVNRELQAEDLQRRIKARSGDTFVGLLRIDENSYLLVFRNDSE